MPLTNDILAHVKEIIDYNYLACFFIFCFNRSWEVHEWRVASREWCNNVNIFCDVTPAGHFLHLHVHI